MAVVSCIDLEALANQIAKIEMAENSDAILSILLSLEGHSRESLTDVCNNDDSDLRKTCAKHLYTTRFGY